MKSSTQSGDFINMGDLVMAIKNRKKRITARISALLLSAAMLCSLSACSDPVAVTKIKGTPTEAGAAESTLLHSVGDKANLQQVGKSGLIELLFDESTYSVCVADLSHDDSEKLWSALPTQENSGAATATLEIVSGDTLYKLNTQDNSVSFQNAQCSFADDALSVTYILAPDSGTAHKEKYDKDDIAKKLTLSYFKQVLKDGFFHGDPHPGNILIRGGKICFIDFGIVGELSKEKQCELNSAIAAIANEDIDKLTDFVMSIGIKSGKVDREILYKDIEYIFRNYYTTSLKNIKISVLFQEMSSIAKRNNLRLASDFTMLIRTMVMVEGLVADLSPELNIISLVIPYAKDYYKEYFLSEFDFNDYLIKGYKLTRDTLNIPSKLVALSDILIKGRGKINIVIEDKDKYIDVLNKMVNRLAFALVIAGMVVASSLIININAEPKVYGISVIGMGGYFVSAILGLWLLISIIRSGSLK